MNEIKCPKCGATITIDENDYDSILKQVRDHEFEKEILKREELLKNEKETSLKLKESEVTSKFNEEINKYKAEILNLKNTIESSEELNKQKLINAKTSTEESFKDEINKLKLENSSLQNSIVSMEKDFETRMNASKELHVQELKGKDEIIEYYKDLKAKVSTKMIGENLETHCNAEFNRVRSIFGAKTYFEKDNDAKSGSKGDFIFRDFDEDGNEIVSIMFEMKNEADTTASKHKNEDFFKELDKDRNEKECEYAVLVSLLEADNETYNQGIYDVSHKYPKMYVIRPQFFIPIITLLRSASLKSMDYKKQLVAAQNASIDITNFESNLSKFKDDFGRNYRIASDKFAKAIEEIDKSIAEMQKVKENLLASDRQLRIANDKAQDITIKKLTKDNETMKEIFEKVVKEEV